jgi:hypothetical protein
MNAFYQKTCGTQNIITQNPDNRLNENKEHSTLPLRQLQPNDKIT